MGSTLTIYQQQHNHRLRTDSSLSQPRFGERRLKCILLPPRYTRRCYGRHYITFQNVKTKTYVPWHEISNNVVCATSKGSDQPAHTRSLIRAFASRFNIIWELSYWLSIIWRSLAQKYTAQARLSLHLSKHHIVGNHMSRLICASVLFLNLTPYCCTWCYSVCLNQMCKPLFCINIYAYSCVKPLKCLTYGVHMLFERWF